MTTQLNPVKEVRQHTLNLPAITLLLQVLCSVDMAWSKDDKCFLLKWDDEVTAYRKALELDNHDKDVAADAKLRQAAPDASD